MQPKVKIQVGKTAIPTDGSSIKLERTPDGYHLAFGSKREDQGESRCRKGGGHNTTQNKRRGHCHDVLTLTLENFSSDIVVENNSNGYVFSIE